MKPNFRKIALILIAITAKKTSAQSSFDMSGLVPQSRIVRRGNTYGLDLGFFGEPLNFTNKKRGPDLISRTSPMRLRPQIRLGGNYYFSELGQVKLANVPLLSPATGASAVTVHDRFWSCNFAARISLPYSAKLIPYADVFGGITDFAASLSVQPYDYMHKSATTQSLYDFASLSYGGAVGVMVPLGKYWKLDFGVVYSSFLNQGKMINTDSARLEAGSVAVDRMDTPQSMLMFKAGLTCCFSGGSWSNGTGYSSGHRYSTSHSHWGGGHCGGSHVSVHVH